MELNVRSFLYGKLKQDLIPRLAARYFRPPYGIVGARTRERLAYFIDNPYIVNWSVDIADWLYGIIEHKTIKTRFFLVDSGIGGLIVHATHFMAGASWVPFA